MSDEPDRNYALAAGENLREIPAPELPYRPPRPRRYRPRLGLIGCGGISAHHLAAYRDAGWDVAALCDRQLERAAQRRAEFYPDARLFADYRELLAWREVDVVDLALHPAERGPVIADSLTAGKHVLSQKPFVTSLDTGAELVELARRQGVKLAVNQNGRWAPYLSYVHHVIQSGLLGPVQTVALRLNWDHTWCRGTPFEDVRHLLLYDFGIHWFDACALFFRGRRALQVQAATAFAAGQALRPALLATASVTFDGGLASLLFDGHSRFGPEESIQVTGTAGTVRTRGKPLANDALELFTAEGVCRPKLEGQWFNDGFRGAMGELLCAIEENREPLHGAADNLRTLEICFAALRSADSGQVQVPGQVRAL